MDHDVIASNITREADLIIDTGAVISCLFTDPELEKAAINDGKICEVQTAYGTQVLENKIIAEMTVGALKFNIKFWLIENKQKVKQFDGVFGCASNIIL